LSTAFVDKPVDKLLISFRELGIFTDTYPYFFSIDLQWKPAKSSLARFYCEFFVFIPLKIKKL